jgi:hypothetical protein
MSCREGTSLALERSRTGSARKRGSMGRATSGYPSARDDVSQPIWSSFSSHTLNHAIVDEE